ncbi:MAG: DUF1641 domain-containing protein [Mariniblastus sp.]|nr:DUF1641 domain-containing protein [Mariniblastus sp.]
MSESKSQTIDQVLFERMGVTVEDAVATGTDVVDEKLAFALKSGIDVDARLTGVGHLIEKISEPSTLAALAKLIDCLPQLAKLAEVADEIPNIVATVGDVLDNHQQRCSQQGIDVEKAISNGLHAALLLGSQVEPDQVQRIADLLTSDAFNQPTINVVDNAAQSLAHAQQAVAESPSTGVGMLGLLSALRDPEIQRSLAFAVEFGKCFGKNFNSPPS